MPGRDQQDSKRRTDLVGKKHARLTVAEYFVERINGRKTGRLRCDCECGGEVVLYASGWGKQLSCGCWRKGPRPKDMAGLRFGCLVVERYAGEQKWLCRCDCGNEYVGTRSHLLAGKLKSCGCLQANRKLSSEEAARRSLYAGYKHTARRKGVPFEIGLALFAELTTSECFYCGAKPAKVHRADHDRGECAYNGIDRVANDDTGYTVGNVVPCCWFCNRTKRDTPYAGFVFWIERVYNSLVEKGEIKCV